MANVNDASQVGPQANAAAASAAKSGAQAAELARRAAEAAQAVQAAAATQAAAVAQGAVQAVVARAVEAAQAAAEATMAARDAAEAPTVDEATDRAKGAARAATQAEIAAEAAARAAAAAQRFLAGQAARENDPAPWGLGWLPFWPRNRPPDFEKTVVVVLATFTVFTGFTTSEAVKAVASDLVFPGGTSRLTFLAAVGALGRFLDSAWSREEFWALVALLSLLLRYLIGSAIHLNDTYVKRVGTPNPLPPELPPCFQPSQSTILLFKDLIFLVVFGIVILAIAKAVAPPTNFVGFTFGSEIFLFCGFAWALLDIPCRLAAGHRAGNDRDREWPGWRAYILWPALDVGQLATTLWISSWSPPAIQPIRWLAAAYVLFLLADIWGYIRSLRTRAQSVA